MIAFTQSHTEKIMKYATARGRHLAVAFCQQGNADDTRKVDA